MNLYEFQGMFVSDIRQSFRSNKRIIGQLATGGGKTVCISEITRLAITAGTIVCIAAHRKEIFNQIARTLERFGIIPELIKPGSNPYLGGSCYLAMIETLCRRDGLFEELNVNFLIVDEAHEGSYFKLINKLDPSVRVLGFSATPKSTGKPDLREYFDDIVCGPPISELIKLGRLVNAATHSVDHDFSKIASDSRDFKMKDLMREFRKPKLWRGAVDNYCKNAMGLRAICYSVDVEQSKSVVDQFRERGVRAIHIDAKMSPQERDYAFKSYENGDVDILCNVGIAVAGYDDPQTECIIQNFATTSLVKHWQSIGRGARSHEGKKKFRIIDMGRNWIRHGKFGTEEVDWKKIFHTPTEANRKKDRKTDLKECVNCGAVIKIRLIRCPYCDSLNEAKQVEEKMGEIASVKEIKALRASTIPVNLRKPTSQMSMAELKEYASHMGYDSKWVFVQMRFRKK